MPLDPDVTRVVVSDAHGNYEAMKAALEEIGAVDSRGRRQDGFYMIQVGDLLDMKPASAARDVMTAQFASRVFDQVLCGNHELWYAWALKTGIFAGMVKKPDPQLRSTITRMVTAGHFQPVCALDGWVISHAGIHRTYQQSLPSDPELLVTEVRRRFEARVMDRMEDPLFDTIGRVRSKGKEVRAGGLFWCDAIELAVSGSRLQQIIGHTPTSVKEPVKVGENLWTIDPGAHRVSVLVKDSHSSDWRSLTAEVNGQTTVTSSLVAEAMPDLNERSQGGEEEPAGESEDGGEE